MKMNKGVVALGLAGMFAICGVTTLLANASDFQDPKAHTNVPVAESDGPGAVVGKEAAKATRSVKPKPTPIAPATIGDGTWEVGTEVKPGRYRTPGAVKGIFELCIWTIKSSDSPDARVIDFGTSNVDEPNRAVLKRGQFFDTSGCETWTAVK